MDETDYFDELLWPLLKEEGWTRDDNFDIIEASGKESGLAVQRVVFTPGKKRNGEVVTLNSVEEALTYINDEPELAKRCFGNRYAESMMTEEALGEDSSDDETVEAEEGDSAAEEKASAPLSEGADEPMPEARDEEATEDVQEAPDFIYDEVWRRASSALMYEGAYSGGEDGGLVVGQAARRAAAAEQASVPVPQPLRPDRPDAGACAAVSTASRGVLPLTLSSWCGVLQAIEARVVMMQ
ncbi:hypothetical protein ON010_g19075 [Phytophthora cinnamomi]|nr:hypothetical protein ON010_g19075 [Phytophthora cinnamomi]